MIDENEIRQQYNEYESEFNETKENLRKTLQHIAVVFYQKTKFRVLIDEPRIKSVESLILKMKRKGIDTDTLFGVVDDQISLVVNDFIGARIICNTREDVNEIAGIIRNFQRFKLIKDPETKNEVSGYRALHLDIYYRDYWKEELIYIPVEIQIKTQLQNAWANITHDEFYKAYSEDLKEELERNYAKHMADILDSLDDMASTVRRHRLSYVPLPNTINDSDTLINQKTLSYKVNQSRKGRLTQQEMTLALNRLKEEGFETLKEVDYLLNDFEIEQRIKTYKEELRNEDNVQPFEILYYGSILKKGKEDKFKNELRKDFGFVPYQCIVCQNMFS